ncbi:homocysteine S-methyltransferase family protein [Thermodesulfobacteriota bacterium]
MNQHTGRKNLFRDKLESGIVLLQGAIPTVLQEYGYPLDQSYVPWIVEHPEVYNKVQQAYIDVGCDVVVAQTGGANRLRLKEFGLEDKALEFNRRLAQLAKKAAPEGYCIEGILARTGHFLAPAGDVTEDELHEIYDEQVSVLVEEGVDYFRVTESDPQILRIMIKAVRNHTDLPVVATMGFNPTKKGYRSLVGIDPKSGAKALAEAGADVIGLVCGGTSLEDVTRVLKEMKEVCSKPLIAKPNAGIPELVDGKPVHPATPEQMGSESVNWIKSGAKVIGGCCGTTPEHMAMVARAVRSFR